jgi:hypothetical protein
MNWTGKFIYPRFLSLSLGPGLAILVLLLPSEELSSGYILILHTHTCKKCLSWSDNKALAWLGWDKLLRLSTWSLLDWVPRNFQVKDPMTHMFSSHSCAVERPRIDPTRSKGTAKSVWVSFSPDVCPVLKYLSPKCGQARKESRQAGDAAFISLSLIVLCKKKQTKLAEPAYT